jgi:hypothetical protein
LEEILEKNRSIGDQCEGFCGLGNRYASLVGDGEDDTEEV